MGWWNLLYLPALEVCPEDESLWVKSLQNPELILETWAPRSINAVIFCPSMITGASLDHPTRWTAGSGFKNGMTKAVSHGPVLWAALMLAGLCLGFGVGMHGAYCWLGWFCW